MPEPKLIQDIHDLAELVGATFVPDPEKVRRFMGMQVVVSDRVPDGKVAIVSGDRAVVLETRS